MQFLGRSSRWSYLIAVVAPISILVALSLISNSAASAFVTSLTYIFSVLAAGIFGGWKPGLLTTVLSLVAYNGFTVTQRGLSELLDRGDVLRTAAYLVAGTAISLLCEGMHAASRRVAERQSRLETEIVERRKAELAVHEQAEQLREADRRKDEFLAMLAHELRNPLAPLSNALQVWPLVEHDREETEKLRALMQRQLQQMTRLIDDLLDVSRITRGKIQLRPQRVNLTTVVKDAIESVRPILDQCRHQISVLLPHEPLEVNGDTARLSQIVGNILHNAAKYTPPNGQIHVVASTNIDQIVLSIRDNGCGIPEQMLSRIFDMFHQVDQTLDRSHGGLGIGLTLVKRLVELHGGTIEARSDGAGKGSEFIVSLPIMAAGDSQVADGMAAIPRHAIENLPRHRILVVDDVQASAQTLSMMLQSIGQDVAIAHDGERALEWVMERKPDFVFLDIAMPGMDGYEVARRIRAVEELNDVVLAALTGYGQEEDRRRALEAGFDFHLTKPAAMELLHAILSRSRDCETLNESSCPSPATT